MNGARTDASAWLRKAEQDFAAAELLSAAGDPPWDVVVFHAQQVAEKLLKGFIVSLGHQPPKSHDLVRLLSLCVSQAPELAALTDECAFLSPLAVLSRYPSDVEESAREDAARAMATARRIRGAIRARLGDTP